MSEISASSWFYYNNNVHCISYQVYYSFKKLNALLSCTNLLVSIVRLSVVLTVTYPT